MQPTTRLSGESIVFVRVAPGYVTQAIRDLRSEPNVTSVEATLGPFDVLVTGSWPDLATVTEFRERVENKPYCQGCDVAPSVQSWNRDASPSPARPLNGWTLIRTADPAKTTQNLRNVPNVSRVHTTIGEYNVIAHFDVHDPTDILTTVTDRIHGFKEVRRTETFVSFRHESH